MTSDLIGRYTCTETVKDKKHEKIVHVYVQGSVSLLKMFTHMFLVDGKSVFTQNVYPAIYKQTGIHFFNIPCQSTNWYSRMSCPNSNQCQSRQCSDREQRVDELKCNIPVCNGQDLCIPVYFTPDNLEPEIKLISGMR